MHRQLTPRVEVADNYVEGDPHDRDPARPVGTTKHVNPGDHGEEADHSISRVS